MKAARIVLIIAAAAFGAPALAVPAPTPVPAPTSIPEPSDVALFAMGIAGVAIGRWMHARRAWHDEPGDGGE